MVSHLTLSEPVSVSSVGQVEITLATGHRLMLSGAFDVDGAPSGQRSGGAMIPVPVSTKVWLAAGVTDILHAAICKRSEEHTSELQSLMRNSYAVFCLKKKTTKKNRAKTSKKSTTHT